TLERRFYNPFLRNALPCICNSSGLPSPETQEGKLANPSLYINHKAVMKKLWLSPPHMGGEEQRYIREAFEQNWIAPLGPNVTGFEEDLESFMGRDVHVAALSSGTAALHLALILLEVG